MQNENTQEGSQWHGGSLSIALLTALIAFGSVWPGRAETAIAVDAATIACRCVVMDCGIVTLVAGSGQR